MADSRFRWVDVAKGLGIILVVVGHVLSGLVNSDIAADQGVVRAADRIIYAFHMPLFFVLSGLFLPRALERPLGTFVRDRFVRLAYPYVIWVTLQTLVQALLSRYSNHPTRVSDLARALYVAPMQFWFLYALLVQSLFLAVAWKLGVRRVPFLVLSIVLAAASPWTPDLRWAPALNARQYLPYLALGVALGAPALFERVGLLLTRGSLGLVLAGYGFVGACYALGWLGTASGAALAALAGTAATAALAVLASAGGRAQVLERLGQASLAIYCAHTIASAATRLVLQRLLGVVNVSVHLVTGTIAGLVAPMALIWASERVGFPYLFELPRRSRARASSQPSAAPR